MDDPERAAAWEQLYDACRTAGPSCTRSGAKRITCGPFYARHLIGAKHTLEDQWHEAFGPTETIALRALARQFRNRKT
jgi:hypothetical protein